MKTALLKFTQRYQTFQLRNNVFVYVGLRNVMILKQFSITNVLFATVNSSCLTCDVLKMKMICIVISSRIRESMINDMTSVCEAKNIFLFAALEGVTILYQLYIRLKVK